MNEFLVSVRGNQIVTLRRIPQQMTREQAVTLAAWLLVLADPDNATYPGVREEVENS